MWEDWTEGAGNRKKNGVVEKSMKEGECRGWGQGRAEPRSGAYRPF